jgi:hypothetical protein
MQSKTYLSIAAAFLLATFAVHEVHAQASAPAKPPRLVNRDELRVCMNAEASLGTKRQALDARRTANQAETAAIRAESAQLAEEQKGIGGSDDRKARQFKRTVDAHNARVQASNATLAAFRGDLEGLSKDATAYNEQCAGITFRTEDKEAILKERAAAAPK